MNNCNKCEHTFKAKPKQTPGEMTGEQWWLRFQSSFCRSLGYVAFKNRCEGYSCSTCETAAIAAVDNYRRMIMKGISRE